MQNFTGRGHKVTRAINGKSVQWTSLSRSFDICPLRVFIMKSIISFIICISAIICDGAVSATDGRLVSCHSCLLKAMLPSDPSWSLLSALMPFCSSPWLLGLASLWHSCSSRLWFCLVRCSTTVAKVYTCLSRAVMHGSSPLLLLVAIERVNTIQLFVWEVVVWLLLWESFPTDDANWWCQKSSVSRTVLMYPRQILWNRNKERPYREYRCGIGQIPSEG